MPRIALALLLLTPAFAQRKGTTPPRPTPLAIASNSQLTLDGGDIHNQSFALSKCIGDWFVLPNDAYASLDLQTATPAPPMTLDIRWFGKAVNHVINAENNTDLTGDHVAFFLTMHGQPPYDLAVKPRGDQAVTVTVVRMDDHDLEARFTSAAEKLRVSGSVVIHRDALPAPRMTGVYGDCDNVIHDKMYGAQSRSPSGCEVRFESDVRRAIHQSMQRVIAGFTSAGWTLDRPPELKPIVSAARNTEKNPFQTSFTSNGDYSLEFRMSPQNPQFQAYQRQTDALMEKLKANPSGGFQELARAGYAMQGATRVKVTANINLASTAITNFHSEHTVLDVPGAAYAVASAHAQAPTGGGEGSSMDVALAVFGNWAPAAIEKDSDGGELISLKANFTPGAPTLSVQNLRIRVEANAELARRVFGQIDYAPLQSLLRH